jgi:hypothetical protein
MKLYILVFHSNIQKKHDASKLVLLLFCAAMHLHLQQLHRVKSSPVTGLEWPRGFQEVKVPRFHDNGTGRW